MSRRLIANLLMIWLVMPAAAAANTCESCFGAAVESDVTIGISWAMTMLLILIMVVFAGILWFFHNMVRRQELLLRGELALPVVPNLLPPESAN